MHLVQCISPFKVKAFTLIYVHVHVCARARACVCVCVCVSTHVCIRSQTANSNQLNIPTAHYTFFQQRHRRYISYSYIKMNAQTYTPRRSHEYLPHSVVDYSYITMLEVLPLQHATEHHFTTS
ncbi:unnamed protein product [Ceratitis capitata]|uniref:(Mediterranean fruit fly) hypothetical protein n=1 Tax=Ceratitis capitata TaxID=7213 RepID=A0A811V1P2_CERCA|nr:unnamed protein product [Ceratitis capitata]